ncbi:MAG: carbohydrate binding family 9 domain-containing protein [Flavobacteriaceae bacterium]|nr:carbohydrate binding family 9 domain-containing protein [Flavobacteriaceae bacterium]
MLKHIVSFFILLSCFSAFSQDKKTIEATRIEIPPKIDGIIDDEIWKSLPVANNFNMWQPGNEGTIPPEYQTEVKIAYDNTAVYFAVAMLDPNPDEILNQLSQRDEVFVQADLFYIALNTYNDGINETRFYITSAGAIGDSRTSQNGEDFNYDVVFSAKMSKDNKGWYAEFKIPYNALRFPEVETQDWSVNFYRQLKTKNETHTWNFIDNKVGNSKLYNGLISGVKNIEAPIRLTFYPFIQGVVSTFDGNTEFNFTGGMDLKYGLTDSFTLDATLIPDFGQAAFDNVVLNLGPFEQTFDENRAFFTEGVELFNKGRIFFSRRIGGPPSGSIGELEDTEEITEYPSSVNIVNAIKVSGRTKKGLGVGILNAITEKTYAKVTDIETGEHRKVLLESLTNYNVFVLDQQFNGNSSVSLVNTNVIRNGSEFKDANVTAGVFDISNKKNSYRTSGRAIFSNVNYGDGFKSGFRSEINIAKTEGNFRYRIGHDFANTTLDINDLGLNFRNNFNNFGGGVSYEIFEPTKKFNKYRINLSARHRRLYKPSIQTENSISLNMFFFTIERFAFGGRTNFRSKKEDYFEPRVDGRFVTFAPNYGINGWISSDFRKKFALDAGLGYRTYIGDPQQNFNFNFEPRYRFSDNFLMVWRTNYFVSNHNNGFIDYDGTDIFFGQRNIANLENSLTASYNFDPYKAIDLRFRNFWGTADYSNNLFYTLNENGSLTPANYDISKNNPNRNFNIWNIDLSFRWRFAPGSEATLLYRNQIFNQDNLSSINYGESLQNLFDQPEQHTVSLRVTYFIDYNNITNLLKKNS